MSVKKRTAVFDPAAADDEFDQLLPAADERAPRGAGGRPPQPPTAPARGAAPVGTAAPAGPAWTTTTVRVPQATMAAARARLLAGPARPSYGQIVAWTCEDRAEEVIAELAAQTAQQQRAPRGARAAEPAHTVKVSFRAAEWLAFDDVVRRAAAAGVASSRSAVAAAAMAVATTGDSRTDGGGR